MISWGLLSLVLPGLPEDVVELSISNNRAAPVAVRCFGVSFDAMKLSDLFEDEKSEAEPAAAAQQPPRAESPPSTPAVAVAPVAVAPAVEKEEEEEEAASAAVDEDTPEGQFVKLSAGTGGVLTLDDLVG